MAFGEGQENLLVSDLLFDLFDLLVDKGLREGGRIDAFHVVRASACLHTCCLLSGAW